MKKKTDKQKLKEWLPANGVIKFGHNWNDCHSTWRYEDGDTAEAVTEAVALLGADWTGGNVENPYEAEPLKRALEAAAQVAHAQATQTDGDEALKKYRLVDKLEELAALVWVDYEMQSLDTEFSFNCELENVKEFLKDWGAVWGDLSYNSDGEFVDALAEFERAHDRRDGLGDRWTVEATYTLVTLNGKTLVEVPEKHADREALKTVRDMFGSYRLMDETMIRLAADTPREHLPAVVALVNEYDDNRAALGAEHPELLDFGYIRDETLVKHCQKLAADTPEIDRVLYMMNSGYTFNHARDIVRRLDGAALARTGGKS